MHHGFALNCFKTRERMDLWLASVLATVFWLLGSSHQLQNSQSNVLLQLRKQLEYPKQLDAWNNTKDLCYLPVSPSLAVVCDGDAVIELKIIGDKLAQSGKYNGYFVAGQTLSSGFSADSFFTTLSRLPGLRVAILVSLGIWGPLPEKIHRLGGLEVLDLSSNYLYGAIPPKISAMARLQKLTLDGNFFNETVPDWFDTLTNITVLSLQRNRLKGPLPASIRRIGTLTDLALSSNSISGGIPDLSGLTRLEVLDMRDNELSFELPTLPRGLVTVLLSKNSLTGEIPTQLGELTRLQHLDISFNLLRGNLPASLFSLPNISYLNLATNMLSGTLPGSMACSSQLGFVDLSTNMLTGSLPSCLNSDSDDKIVKFQGNCLTGDSMHQHEAAYCQVNHYNGKSLGSKHIGMIVAAIAGIVIVLVSLLLVFLILCRRTCKRVVAERLLPKSVQENSSTGFSSELLANARYISQTAKLGTQVLPTYRVFSIEELKEATRNFERSSFIGEGSVGKLYKGRLENGNFVAIRCLALFKRYSIRNLKLRLDLLSKLRHPHLVCLLGHCIDGAPDNSGVSRVFLVYEYVPNGSLRASLSNSNPEKVLKWTDRLAVLTGIAKAVHFLHTGIIAGFLNNRLRTNNILLDEHHIAKVSDYGLSIITEEIYKYDARGEGQKSIQSKYSALEMVKLKDDVYSFGLILLETLVEPSITETGEAFFCRELVASLSSQEERKHVLDPVVLDTSSQESLSIVISLTHKCLFSESSSSPSVEDVLWNLQYAAQVQANAGGDLRSGPIS